MRVFITGVAGFIGSTLAHLLLDQGHQVAGIDSLNDYYDPTLKTARLDRLMTRDGFAFTEGKIETPGLLADLFSTGYDAVVHLAAQAGVRYSIDNPRAYLEANLIGTFELLEAARAHPPKHMLLASTSSAYGANTDMPYVETQRADHQMSFYAAPVTGRPASENDSLSPVAPFRVLNIGNNSPVELGDFIRAIETSCGKEAVKNLMPMQAGDVPATWADTSLLHALTQYKPSTSVEEGVDHFVRWYRAYYGI